MLPIAVTVGEPAGIGPELVAALWRQRVAEELPPFYVIGPANILAEIDRTTVKLIATAEECATLFQSALPVVDTGDAIGVIAGEPSPLHAPLVISAIENGARDCLEHQARALVTGPIQKASLVAAGFGFAGHTDFLARICGLRADESVMMLLNSAMRVAPVTHHMALADVSEALNAGNVRHTIRVVLGALENQFGIKAPKLAVAALNPHAGEGGIFGKQEAEIISPIIQQFREQGVDIDGPLAPDSMFTAQNRAKYDAFIAMYHDQGLIPLKTLDANSGVNLTLNLPFIRTSPDHGTALSLAGTGRASPQSMIEALHLADRLSRADD